MDSFLTPQFFSQIIIAAIAALATGTGLYMAIRLDLLRAHMLAEEALKGATRANDRLDNLRVSARQNTDRK